MAHRGCITRLFKAFIGEVRHVTTPEVVLAALIGIAAFVYQGMTGGFSTGNILTFLVPAVWVGCALGFLFVVKAATIVRKEDKLAWVNWKSPIHGNFPKPAPPSAWPVTALASCFSLFFVAVVALTLRLPLRSQKSDTRSEIIEGRMELHVESVEVNLVPGKPIFYRVKVSNGGKVQITAPRHTLVQAITENILGDLGERRLFSDLLDSTTTSVTNPLLEIQPGRAAFFTAGDPANPPTGHTQMPVLLAEHFKALEEGKKRLYMMILLQYGPELKQPFDDGINRAHSVFCSYSSKGEFAKGPSLDGPYYCNGFNYVRP